jgi:hypothetical protein
VVGVPLFHGMSLRPAWFPVTARRLLPLD